MGEWLSFRQALTVVLDGQGNGAIRFSPSIGEYLVEQVAATVTTNTNEPELLAYINGMYVGGSYSGSRTNDTSFNQRVTAQEDLSIVWVGGDAGATATVVLTGKKRS